MFTHKNTHINQYSKKRIRVKNFFLKKILFNNNNNNCKYIIQSFTQKTKKNRIFYNNRIHSQGAAPNCIYIKKNSFHRKKENFFVILPKLPKIPKQTKFKIAFPYLYIDFQI